MNDYKWQKIISKVSDHIIIKEMKKKYIAIFTYKVG